jgi:6-phosphofructokinase
LTERDGFTKFVVYAARLSEEGVAAIGILKSVYDDVSGSNYSPGSSTAIRRDVRFVNEMRDIAAAREKLPSSLFHQLGNVNR